MVPAAESVRPETAAAQVQAPETRSLTPAQRVGLTARILAEDAAKELRRVQRGRSAAHADLFETAPREATIIIHKGAPSLLAGTAEYEVTADVDLRKGEPVPSTVDNITFNTVSHSDQPDELPIYLYTYRAKKIGSNWTVTAAGTNKDGSYESVAYDTSTEFNGRWQRALGNKTIGLSAGMLNGEPIGLTPLPQAVQTLVPGEGGTRASTAAPIRRDV